MEEAKPVSCSIVFYNRSPFTQYRTAWLSHHCSLRRGLAFLARALIHLSHEPVVFFSFWALDAFNQFSFSWSWCVCGCTIRMNYLSALIEVLAYCFFWEQLSCGEAIEIFLKVDELIVCYLIFFFFMSAAGSYRSSTCKNH